MRVVAVGTLHQALFHLVVKGHGELRLDVGVALEAELRLRDLEQVLRIFAGVNAVAAHAADIGFTMAGALKVGVLVLVASQAARIHFLRCCLGRVEYFRDVSAALHMSPSGPVAVLARNAILAVRQGEPAVRVVLKSLCHFLVA